MELYRISRNLCERCLRCYVMSAGTLFYQQKLPAWRPNITSASTTIPCMIVIGLVYICIGMAIHYTSTGVCTT